MLYIDTSVLVAVLTAESQTERMLDFLGAQHAEPLAVSDWTITEFSSALSLKVRMKQLEVQHRNSSLAAFHRLVGESFETLPITGTQFRSAAQIADQYAAGIRARDALHLAVAIHHGATIYTLDRKFAEAAENMGAIAKLL
ncbi:type II toxin-antitoxin system VapC family toxin [Phyllobacterium meliloti]|uniref:type II toxin-antitoxin system VapC family toxin n=1 Tax=Phyllobacterium meliloti TaxID=555317 RepID=UPI001D147110|nr:type II toxin-antitoxin system VapC family toxin [Phyllobacterium sp. T1293]UGX87329.1 type II toxin-antitoxin system VapC family toxin [Phyllobacterium sp. T1293]